MRYVLMVLLFTISVAAYPTIYMTVNNGNTTYSDTPSKSSTPIEVTPTNVTRANQPPSQTDNTKQGSSEETPAGPQSRKEYVTFQITSPGQDETIQNQPVIPVEFKIDPALQTGDKIQLYLDGKPYGEAMPSVHMQYSLLDRGKHDISAAIIDVNLQVIKKSNVNTIYVHQQHLGGDSAPGPSGP